MHKLINWQFFESSDHETMNIHPKKRDAVFASLNKII
jgi:hypothetical protein